MEVEVGITERICVGECFPGVLKHIYQDFHVKEIDLEGNILELDELITRKKVADEIRAGEDHEQSLYASIGPEFEFKIDQATHLESLVSKEDFETLKTFLTTPINEETPYCTLSSEKLNGDKENRKNFHSFIREHFGPFLATDTFESPEARSIRVWIKKYHSEEQNRYKADFTAARQAPGGRNKKHKLNDGTASVGVMMKDPWPKDRPNYLHFRLYKENRDTAEAIQSISRCLRIPPKSFQFAGTKDRRGITVQSVSVYRISMEAMKRAILHSSWDKAIRVSHLEYKELGNKVGLAGGNHFEIAIKCVAWDFSNTRIDSLFTQLRDNGFLNYYGTQRFGSRVVRTHDIGAMLLSQEWKRVVDTLLSPEADKRKGDNDDDDREQDTPITQDQTTETEAVTDRTAWRREYASGNIKQAHELCPSFLYIEKSLLRSLNFANQSTNFLNAIQSLPTTTVHLYLHSVQSLVFNAALSERIRTHGSKVVVGDLVMVGDDVVKIESQQEAEKYPFDDVVLTLVGSQVVVPPNMESFYNEFLSTKLGNGISMETFKNPSLPKFMQLPGAYRRILARAENLSWRILDNIHPGQVVIESDVDRLKEKEGIAVLTDPQVHHAADPTTTTPSKAVVFKCSLKPGCYLTIAVREVTSATNQ